MSLVKNIFNRMLSLGVYSQMEDNKKIAIQIANFDGIASLVTFVFYFIYTFNSKNLLVEYCHLGAVVLCSIGLYLIYKRKYDAGRILIFFVGLAEIFINVDGVVLQSGFEFYYFAPIIVPFFVFTPEELNKSVLLSLCGFSVFLLQQVIGPGHLSAMQEVASSERVMTIAILFMYIIGLFSISRWQMNYAQKKIKSQQSELIHISNIAALGEMSGGIAHEINNPLQILTTQLSVTKRMLKDVQDVPGKVNDNLELMEGTILRISKLVKGLKNLSRNVHGDASTVFPVSEAIDDMLAVSSQKLKYLDINLEIKGNTRVRVKGHMVQLSQVLINLLNNSVDAIDQKANKWIVIDILETAEKVCISLTDCGQGIPSEVAFKIMHPFFTTKEPGRGTGLGLSISKSMIEKVQGRLFYDIHSPHTKFVIELPKVA